MPQFPDGEEWPDSGALNPQLVEGTLERPFAAYVHVPFCLVRCGYCDFNTYTSQFGVGADLDTYSQSVVKEITHSARILSEAGLPKRSVRSLFFGGGTPSLLDPGEIGAIIDSFADKFGLADDAEITLEANPETVDADKIAAFMRYGVNRVSVGMQSSVPSVLKTLDRQHRPERVGMVVDWVRQAGMQVSLDLIYGAPGETLSQWESSLQTAIQLEPDHISAYALVVEEGTKMWQDIRRGKLTEPDPDDEADKYELADSLLASAGYRWYEISNFARQHADETPRYSTNLRAASRHNLAYWRDWDWWGYGPGAHSHIGRYRWWNRKHPLQYAATVSQGRSPGLAGETLSESTRDFEQLMLMLRTSEGISLSSHHNPVMGQLLEERLLDLGEANEGKAVLTLRGRLLADYVTTTLSR